MLYLNSREHYVLHGTFCLVVRGNHVGGVISKRRHDRKSSLFMQWIWTNFYCRVKNYRGKWEANESKASTKRYVIPEHCVLVVSLSTKYECLYHEKYIKVLLNIYAMHPLLYFSLNIFLLFCSFKVNGSYKCFWKQMMSAELLGLLMVLLLLNENEDPIIISSLKFSWY